MRYVSPLLLLLLSPFNAVWAGALMSRGLRVQGRGVRVADLLDRVCSTADGRCVVLDVVAYSVIRFHGSISERGRAACWLGRSRCRLLGKLEILEKRRRGLHVELGTLRNRLLGVPSTERTMMRVERPSRPVSGRAEEIWEAWSHRPP